MRQWHAAVILSCFALPAASGVPAHQTAISAEAVLEAVRREIDAARVPGAAVAIVIGDRVHTAGLGVADVESRLPLTSSTLLPIGSLTKLLTALGTTAALDARRLPLDTSVGRFITGLQPRAAAATFHELLSQTSGLRDVPGEAGSDDEAALAAAARALGDADFLLPAGTVFSYANPGYALAGAALGELVKQPFADALRTTALEPLGMTATAFRTREMGQRPRAVGHRAAPGAAPAAVRAETNDTRLWPAGYLWSNADDMGRLLQAILSEGRVGDRQALPARVVARVTGGHTPMPNVFAQGQYGYGVMVASDRGVRFLEHGGTHPGYSAILRAVPERRFGFIILSNLDNAPLRRVAQQVMRAALGLRGEAPASRPETPVTVEEFEPLLGVYRNRGTAELALRDGRVVLILDDGPPMAVTRIGADRFLARPKPEIAGPEFVLRPATRSSPAYLHFALWAYVRP
jgi:CubicO group peptidase (beta-lactamase class C family)